MPRFVDFPIPQSIRGWPCIVVPKFSTAITQVDSGAEQANRRWYHPLYRYQLPEAIRKHADFETIKDHWLAMGGPAQTWPWRDPLDFASCPLTAPNKVPVVSRLDQFLGEGDGVRTQFQLVKTYQRGPAQYTRDVTLPLVASVVLGINGVDPGALTPPNTPLTFTVSRPGGVVQFSGPVPGGMNVTAGYLFDVEVRFENDESFEGIAKEFTASGVATLNLVSVRSC
jgi:uncharacterized protein (TIGR02217 family)